MIANGVQTGFGDDWIRLGATSNILSTGRFRNAPWRSARPIPGGTPAYYGNVTEEQPALDAWVERVHRAGIQVNCHANGDVAIDMVLTALNAPKKRPGGRSASQDHPLHAVNDDLVRRIKAVGAVPAPFTSYAYYNADKFSFYGEALMRNCMAFRHSSMPASRCAPDRTSSPGPFAPLMGMQGMVTRTGWNGETWGANQRVSVAEALRINTLNGAHASREEAIKGSITAGKLADYVVLADDLDAVAPGKIKDIPIARTVTGGRKVYSA